jgi:CheY-like chemotaxis protein
MTESNNRPRIEAQAANERPHVLIISDDPGLTEFMAEGLPLGGFWTSVISSGLQALEVFRLRQFDLIVLDWEMQGFDAHELLRRLRGVSDLDSASAPRTESPVIVISTAPDTNSPRDDERLGVVANLVAPLELADVVHTLHVAFAEWRKAHPDISLSDSAAMRAR